MRAGMLFAVCFACVCNCETNSSPDASGGVSGGHVPADASHDTGTDAHATGGAGGTTMDSGAGDADADACFLIYNKPGCGDAAPNQVCSPGEGGACTRTLCSCDGVTFKGGCGYESVEPFASIGECDAGGD